MHNCKRKLDERSRVARSGGCWLPYKVEVAGYPTKWRLLGTQQSGGCWLPNKVEVAGYPTKLRLQVTHKVEVAGYPTFPAAKEHCKGYLYGSTGAIAGAGV